MRCVFIAISSKEASGKGAHQKLGQFVNTPCIHYRKLFGKDGCITMHLKKEYHINANVKAKNFINRFKNPEKCDIQMIIDKSRKDKAKNNRKILISLLDNIFIRQAKYRISRTSRRGHKFNF